MPVYVKAALPSPPFAVLTYELPEYLPASAFVPGSRAVAPLGGGYRAVVVIGPEEKAPEGVETRPLLWPLEREPLLRITSYNVCYTKVLRNKCWYNDDG